MLLKVWCLHGNIVKSHGQKWCGEFAVIIRADGAHDGLLIAVGERHGCALHGGAERVFDCAADGAGYFLCESNHAQSEKQGYGQ